MVPPNIEQPGVGGLACPKVKRHRPPLEEIIHASHDLELGLLDDIRRVHTGSKPWIQTDLNESTQVRPVSLQQLVQGLPVPTTHAL
jgi:hypothetical protein